MRAIASRSRDRADRTWGGVVNPELWRVIVRRRCCGPALSGDSCLLTTSTFTLQVRWSAGGGAVNYHLGRQGFACQLNHKSERLALTVTMLSRKAYGIKRPIETAGLAICDQSLKASAGISGSA